MLAFERDLGMEKFLFGLIVAGILPVLAQAADMEDVARPWRDYWNAHRAQCEADIEVVRKSNGRIVITDENGSPMPGAECLIRQTGSDFVWGCSGLSLGQLGSMEAEYDAKLAEIFNMVTTTFCPGAMRPEPDVWRFDEDSAEIYRRPPSDRVLAFCRKHGLKMKGQPLLCDHWHPKWAMKQTKAEAEVFYREWFRGVADRYGMTVWYFDVVNEAFDTWKRTPDFPLYGGDEELPFVDWAFAEAGKVFPTNCLLGINMGINSTTWDDGPRGGKRYFRLCKRILDGGHRLDAIGFQFHLFGPERMREMLGLKLWHPDSLKESYRTFATLGRPLYINEITIPAVTLPGAAGEALQAEVAEDLYRFWFSCKELKGVTWWNLFDGATWVNEGGSNGALLDRFMREKPAYTTLRRLIKREWNTSFLAKAGDDGAVSFRGFRGTYEAIVMRNEKLRTIKFRLTEDGVVRVR